MESLFPLDLLACFGTGGILSLSRCALRLQIRKQWLQESLRFLGTEEGNQLIHERLAFLSEICAQTLSFHPDLFNSNNGFTFFEFPCSRRNKACRNFHRSSRFFNTHACKCRYIPEHKAFLLLKKVEGLSFLTRVNPRTRILKYVRNFNYERFPQLHSPT